MKMEEQKQTPKFLYDYVLEELLAMEKKEQTIEVRSAHNFKGIFATDTQKTLVRFGEIEIVFTEVEETKPVINGYFIGDIIGMALREEVKVKQASMRDVRTRLFKNQQIGRAKLMDRVKRAGEEFYCLLYHKYREPDRTNNWHVEDRVLVTERPLFIYEHQLIVPYFGTLLQQLHSYKK